jgi:hypothetical protein
MAKQQIRPEFKTGQDVELVKGQYTGRQGKVLEIAEPTPENGNLYLITVELPEGKITKTWEYPVGKTNTQTFLVPGRTVRCQPQSVQAL